MRKIVFLFFLVLVAHSSTILPVGKADSHNTNYLDYDQETSLLGEPDSYHGISSDRLLQVDQLPDRQIIIRDNTFDAIHYFQIK